MFYVYYFFFNLSNDITNMSVHLFVAEAHHVIALFLQKLSSPLVGNLLLGLIMVATIHFNDQSISETEEVCNIVSYRMLPPELTTLYLLAQCIPEYYFAFRHLPPIMSGKFLQHRIPVWRSSFVAAIHISVELVITPLSPRERGRG